MKWWDTTGRSQAGGSNVPHVSRSDMRQRTASRESVSKFKRRLSAIRGGYITHDKRTYDRAIATDSGCTAAAERPRPSSRGFWGLRLPANAESPIRCCRYRWCWWFFVFLVDNLFAFTAFCILLLG